MHNRFRPNLRRAALLAAALPLLTLTGCHLHGGTSSNAPDNRAAIIDAFYAGLAALDAGDNAQAEAYLTRLTAELLPNDPVGWADLGLYKMRQGQVDQALVDLNKARDLAAAIQGDAGAGLQAQIEGLLGQTEAKRGQFSAALDHLRSAVKLRPDDLRLQWALAQVVDQGGGPDADREYAAAIARIEQAQPDNLAVAIEGARIAARAGDATGLKAHVERIAKQRSAQWPSESAGLLDQLRMACAPGGNPRAAVTQVLFLHNDLKQVPAFRDSVEVLEGPPKQTGTPIRALATIAMPMAQPAPVDVGLKYAVSPVGDASLTAAVLRFVGPLNVGSSLLAADATSLRLINGSKDVKPLAFSGDGSSPNADSILPIDLNFTFHVDLVAAGAGGLRFYRQASGSGVFTDVTATTKLPANVTGGNWAGVHAADIEADGDLDIVAIPHTGPVVVLQNNGDGTLTPTHPFPHLQDVDTPFVWADIEGTGIADAAFVDRSTGSLRVFSNERSGQFRELTAPKLTSRVVALATGDFNGDGVLDLIVWTADGQILDVSPKTGTQDWTITTLAKTKALPQPGSRLFAADLDNNSAVDLVASLPGSPAEIFLFGAPGSASTPIAGPSMVVQEVADTDDNGTLSLIGIDLTGKPAIAHAMPTKRYGWLEVHPKAQNLTRAGGGDQRINSFGVGGLLQVRTGLTVTTLPIKGSTVHIGLGEADHADIGRIVWPNGQPQVEFGWKGNQTVVAEQRLKGSCPFLYAWDGADMRFVTDIIWRSPLGLKINGQITAPADQTEDWVKIRAEQLVPRDGIYDLRITADLWETHFFDRVTLMTVDHPTDAEVWVDERFSATKPTLDLYVTRPPQPLAAVVTDTGLDVRELLAKRDGRYVDDFGRGRYQGVTRDHYLEVALPPDAPMGCPLYLLCHGWIHPTDASLNVAMSQGDGASSPQGLTLETQASDGTWRTVRDDLGFPAGKLKMVVLRIDDLWPHEQTADRRLRLRTNLEIYWGQITWAEGIDDATIVRQTLDAETATLGYRGIGAIRSANASSPELPVAYDAIESTGQYWRDLTGYYTRYGDIRPLLRETDDRYAILNAGDEIRLTFPAPPPPPAGWTRDFVLISDGWVKDGDFNTTWGDTVLPLPSHALADYPDAPGALGDDPVYREHREDWVTYHTRYVAPDRFRGGLVVGVGSRGVCG